MEGSDRKEGSDRLIGKESRNEYRKEGQNEEQT